MTRDEAFAFVGKELDWQKEKWKRGDGDWPDHPFRKLAVLAEEFGEIAMAANEAVWSDAEWHHVRDELADTAAVCIAWLMADF